MTDRRVVWSDAARLDLQEILSFVAFDSPENARKILERLERRCSNLARFPKRGRLVPELKAVDVLTYRELIEIPWRITYRFEANRVYVMAVLDARRNLSGLLLERLTR